MPLAARRWRWRSPACVTRHQCAATEWRRHRRQRQMNDCEVNPSSAAAAAAAAASMTSSRHIARDVWDRNAQIYGRHINTSAIFESQYATAQFHSIDSTRGLRTPVPSSVRPKPTLLRSAYLRTRCNANKCASAAMTASASSTSTSTWTASSDWSDRPTSHVA